MSWRIARLASPILTRRVTMNVGLPGWFVASGLRVTVKQRDSRGMPGFFATIFSVVTQFGVCPVGPQNLRMDFLGRTAIRCAVDVVVCIHTER